jgi:hypothetical protein
LGFWDSGFGIRNEGLRAKGVGFQGLGIRDQGSDFRVRVEVWGLGFKVQDLGFVL